MKTHKYVALCLLFSLVQTSCTSPVSALPSSYDLSGTYKVEGDIRQATIAKIEIRREKGAYLVHVWFYGRPDDVDWGEALATEYSIPSMGMMPDLTAVMEHDGQKAFLAIRVERANQRVSSVSVQSWTSWAHPDERHKNEAARDSLVSTSSNPATSMTAMTDLPLRVNRFSSLGTSGLAPLPVSTGSAPMPMSTGSVPGTPPRGWSSGPIGSAQLRSIRSWSSGPISISPLSPQGESVNVTSDIDFGPYMADIQRRIKRAWFPSRGQESRRVRVNFRLNSQGFISALRIDASSGVATVDQAALQAAQNAAPFRPLPAGSPELVDVNFTFDYNVFAGGRSF